MSEFKLTTTNRTIKNPLNNALCAYVNGNCPHTAYAITDDGSLHRIDTQIGAATKLLDLPEGVVTPAHRIELTVGFEDQYLAVTYQQKDNHDLNRGFILNLKTNEITIPLDIGDYRTGHTRFPVAFCLHNGRQIVIHGTDWNKIDATDLLTSEMLTQRDLEQVPEADKDWDCFSEWNGHIAVSPDHKRAACVGWVWHPIGLVYSWRLDNWLNGNPFEVDVSADKQSHAAWEYFWDSDIRWVDNTRLAIWAGHEMPEGLKVPHVSIIDVEDEAQQLIIEGPENHFYLHGDTLIAKVGSETGLWCCNTGMPLGRFSGELYAYHPVDSEWLTMEADAWHFTHWAMTPTS